MYTLKSFAKRAIDIAAAAVILVALSPFLAVVAVMVRKKLGSPVVYRQVRPGIDGLPFTITKFRTMSERHGPTGELMPDSDRLSPFGNLLRATSVDELLELWNVLKGDMSLVGPRPLLTRYTRYFTNEERLRLSMRPGITGWAQVNGRNMTSWDERLSYDVWYVRNWTLSLDLRILIRTVRGALIGQGVVVDPESVMMNLDDERSKRSSLD